MAHSNYCDDLAAIVDVTLSYATAVDHRDWELFASIFTDPFGIDMSSVSGRPPTSISPTRWAKRVSSLAAFDATQHMITNHRVTFTSLDGDGHADSASCCAEVRAQHWMSPESMASFGLPAETVSWAEIGGHYTYTMIRIDGSWKIAGYALVIRWRTGNDRVFELANQRASD